MKRAVGIIKKMLAKSIRPNKQYTISRIIKLQRNKS